MRSVVRAVRGALPALALLLAITGCAARRPGATAAGARTAAAARAREAVVEVKNNSWQPVRVSVGTAGRWTPLGRLDSGERRRFRLPPSALQGRVRLRAVWGPEPHEALVTEELSFLPGLRAEWMLLDSPGGNPGWYTLTFH